MFKSQNFKNKAIVTAMLWLVFCFLHAAEDPETEYKQAAAFYKANNFENAASKYEAILSSGYKTSEVYYNLANCYYKLNNIGKAILNYERALKLSPNDEDIQHNLKLAEQKAVDRIQPVPQLAIVTWWQNFTTWQTSSGWKTFAATALWLALLMFAFYLFTSIKRVTFFAGSLLLLLSIVFISLAFKQYRNEQYSDEAIVMLAVVNVKSAPDTNGNDIFVVHEGLKLRILDKVGTWYKVRLADGKTGWLESTSFSRI
jgi:tetratricopeptide (TPR) repeat protein